jgi:hypothetical protein
MDFPASARGLIGDDISIYTFFKGMLMSKKRQSTLRKNVPKLYPKTKEQIWGQVLKYKKLTFQDLTPNNERIAEWA